MTKEAHSRKKTRNASLRARLNLQKGKEKDRQPQVSFQEIARALGISEIQARMSFEMGMKKLRGLLLARGITFNYAQDGEWKF